MMTADLAPTIAENLTDVSTQIRRAAADCGRDPGEITLVAVSKKQPDDRIDAALAAGHHVFGENRVQEAEARWAHRREGSPGLVLHLIGPLQTNKARDAVALFDMIETIDRPRLADAVADAMAKANRRLRCLIQVNTGEEPQKAGVLPADLDALYRHATEQAGLEIAGLMCIPPIDQAPAPHFALVAEAANRLSLPVKSMGMSGDFEIAIHQGATLVRVGTGIFGLRPI